VKEDGIREIRNMMNIPFKMTYFVKNCPKNVILMGNIWDVEK